MKLNYEMYSVYEKEEIFLKYLKNRVVLDVQGQSEFYPELETVSNYDEAVDGFEDYILDDYSIEEEIRKVEKQERVLNEIKIKINNINDIIDKIQKDFTILDVQISNVSVSTYLKVKEVSEFYKKYEDNIDIEFLGEPDGSIRISDHEVGGNEFYNYSHSEFEFLI